MFCILPRLLVYLWATLASNLGGNEIMGPPMGGQIKFTTFRWTLFNCYMVGSVIWMSYQASLTSELSVVKIVDPFFDLHSLYQTDYK
jgi:hypothetical protein